MNDKIQSYRKDVIDFFDMCVLGKNTVQVRVFKKHLDELIRVIQEDKDVV